MEIMFEWPEMIDEEGKEGKDPQYVHVQPLFNWNPCWPI